MTARVCVVGSVNADLTFTVNALPRPGQTVLASSLTSSPGGKGGNQAVAAARAGASVQLVAALGSDSAAEQLRRTSAPTTSGSTAWSPCPDPAARRSSWWTPRPRTTSWSRRAPTRSSASTPPISAPSSPTATSCCCNWRSPSPRRSPPHAWPGRQARPSSSTPPLPARDRTICSPCPNWPTSSWSTRPRRVNGTGPYRIW